MVVHKPQETSQACHSFGLLHLQLGLCRLQTPLADFITQILYFWHEKGTLHLQPHSSLLQPFEHLLQIT